MPRAEDEAMAVAEAAPRRSDGSVDLDVYREEYERRVAARQELLLRDARASSRAMDGWDLVRDPDHWEETYRRAADDLDGGSFLIDRLGAERHLDPTLVAVLLILRRRLVDQYGATGAAELMLIDLAVLSYYHCLRINGWIGNLAALVEHDFFDKEPLGVGLERRYGRGAREIRGLRAEEHVRRIGEQLLPLLDRSNRMLERNLRALKALREAPAPSVTIGTAGQVNLAAAQTNTIEGGTAGGPGEGRSAPATPSPGARSGRSPGKPAGTRSRARSTTRRRKAGA